MTILTGDVATVLSQYPDNHFHGLLTDPPYELGFMGKSWDKALPSVDTWRQLHRVLMPGAHGLVFGHPRMFWKLGSYLDAAGFEIRDTLMWLYGTGFPKSRTLSPGVGTSLKPAYEPILLVRKPLDGTLQHTHDTHGTAGLNIGGVRDSRWPANVLIDDSDELQNQRFSPYYTTATGDAPRWRYEPKVSRAEREVGCEHLPHVSAAENLSRSPDAKGINNPRAGATRGTGARNHHPCLKPVALTQWLATIIMIPTEASNGQSRLIVPFAGAGSEIIGACKAGWSDVTGIEQDERYVDIAKARLSHWLDR